MNGHILFIRHETTKARGTEINLYTKIIEKEKGRAFRRERFLKILKVYSGNSDHYYCTLNRGMETGRLSKDHV